MRALIVVAALMLAGCARGDRADGKILWDAQGCAYLASKHLVDTSFVNRIPDADKATCK